jgi:hypothetical protein
VRPVSDKNRRRDVKRNRAYGYAYMTYGDDWASGYKSISFYPKKEVRKRAAKATRRYKGMLPFGNTYKKVYDVPWEVY